MQNSRAADFSNASAASELLRSSRSASLPTPLGPLFERTTVLSTRHEFNAAALGALLFFAVHPGAQPTWAGVTQPASPSPSEPTQADAASEEQRPIAPPISVSDRSHVASRRLSSGRFLSQRPSPPSTLTSCFMPRMAAPGPRLPYTLRIHESRSKERDDRGAQFSERTDVQVGIHYAVQISRRVSDACPLYNYGLTPAAG
jgi:hypothetical protein